MKARARNTAVVPSSKEVEEHNLDHAVFRSWCPHCVKGRAESYGHRRREGELGGVPVGGVDYMYMHSEQEKEEEKGMPIIVLKDNKTRTVMAKVVSGKGVNNFAVEVVKKFIEQLGYGRIVLRSDNEPAILALKEAVRRESNVEIVMEEVPVGDHQANGLVESAIKSVQGQFRVIKDALESRTNEKLHGEHPAVPWMVMHASSIRNRGRKDEGFHGVPKMEKERLPKASGGIRGVCSVPTSHVRRE